MNPFKKFSSHFKNSNGNGNPNGSKNIPTSKKIGFLSVILLSIGSSIGAGIFFQNQTVISNANMPGNPGGTVALAITSWVVASISVIAMGIALLEIVSAQKDDRGIVGWTKIFSHKILYKACKNFFVFIGLPIGYFTIPFYVLLSFQNALGFNWPWWVFMIVAFCISTWFLFVSGLFSKLGNISNLIILAVKFLPIVFAILIGYFVTGIGVPASAGAPTPPIPDAPIHVSVQPFNMINPGLGVVLSIPAIFFAFDGFYAAAGVQSQVKNPKKTPLALGIGLSITTFIYVMITISILIVSSSSQPDVYSPSQTIQSNGITQFFFEHKVTWMLVAINFFIGFGVLGIINGLSIFVPHLYEDLIRDNEIPFTKRFKSKLSRRNIPIVGVLTFFVIAAPLFLIFSLIGALAFFNASGFGGQYNLIELSRMQGEPWSNVVTGGGAAYYQMEVSTTHLFSMVNLMGQWNSLFVFVFIGVALIGALRNRSTKKVAVEKARFFKTAAWISSIVVMTGMTFVFISAFGNLIMTALDYNVYLEQANAFGENPLNTTNPYILYMANKNDISAQTALMNFVDSIKYHNNLVLKGQISKICVLFAYVLGSFLPIIWDYKSEKKNNLIDNKKNNLSLQLIKPAQKDGLKNHLNSIDLKIKKSNYFK